MKILLVEDDRKVASFIAQGLREASYLVDTADDGIYGETLANQNDYDLAILDVMIPKKSGYALCKHLRMQYPTLPILLLTALDSTDDKIQGFDMGADDYLPKPFEFRELLVRVRALLRRNGTNNSSSHNVLTLSDLTLDRKARIATRGSTRITLTAKEYALLEYLLLHAGQVLSKTQISEHVWDSSFDSGSNTVEVYINFLRRKIDKDFPTKLIHTQVGMGYVMKDISA